MWLQKILVLQGKRQLRERQGQILTINYSAEKVLQVLENLIETKPCNGDLMSYL